jgi:hypothetical protein
LFFLFAVLAMGQAVEPSSPPVQDKYAFGVIPNNRTTEASLPFEPITEKRKMTIAAKDSFALPIYFNTMVFATLYQFENENPSFGQGTLGYAKRMVASFGDQAIGNMMTEGVMPSLLKEDPRYFRIGEGSKKYRTAYALTRIFVTHTDSGSTRFNFSELLGNSAAVAFSNVYYPDTRTASENVEKLAMQLATDAFSNALKEFWPDVKRHFLRKRELNADH